MFLGGSNSNDKKTVVLTSIWPGDEIQIRLQIDLEVLEGHEIDDLDFFNDSRHRVIDYQRILERKIQIIKVISITMMIR